MAIRFLTPAESTMAGRIQSLATRKVGLKRACVQRLLVNGGAECSDAAQLRGELGQRL